MNLFLVLSLLAFNIHLFPGCMHKFFTNTPETKTQPSFHKHFLVNEYIKEPPALSPFVDLSVAIRFCGWRYGSFYFCIIANINLLLSIFVLGHGKIVWTWIKRSWVYFPKYRAEMTKKNYNKCRFQVRISWIIELSERNVTTQIMQCSNFSRKISFSSHSTVESCTEPGT